MAFGPNKTEGKNGYFKFEEKGVFILHLDTNKEAWATICDWMLSYNCGWREPQVNKVRMKEQQEFAPSMAAWILNQPILEHTLTLDLNKKINALTI